MILLLIDFSLLPSKTEFDIRCVMCGLIWCQTTNNHSLLTWNEIFRKYYLPPNHFTLCANYLHFSSTRLTCGNNTTLCNLSLIGFLATDSVFPRVCFWYPPVHGISNKRNQSAVDLCLKMHLSNHLALAFHQIYNKRMQKIVCPIPAMVQSIRGWSENLETWSDTASKNLHRSVALTSKPTGNSYLSAKWTVNPGFGVFSFLLADAESNWISPVSGLLKNQIFCQSFLLTVIPSRDLISTKSAWCHSHSLYLVYEWENWCQFFFFIGTPLHID